MFTSPAPGSMSAGAERLVRGAARAYGGAMSTDARSTARRYYEGSGRSLGADVAALAANPQGVIVWHPQLVALMKPVEAACPQDWEQLACPVPGADAWYVHLLVGDLALARALGAGLPALRWLCFQRGARSSTLHRWSWERFVPTSA